VDHAAARTARLPDLRPAALFRIRTPGGGRFHHQEAVSWRQAATLTLCLLTPDMQNRRIIDGLFVDGRAGKPQIKVETDSFVALIAHVRSGEWSSVVPNTLLTLVGHGNAQMQGLRAIPLIEPRASQTIGFVVSDRDPLSPLAHALLKSARQLDVSVGLRQLL
jgi:DNA-binding transcriptional LysR family regulator